MKIRNGFVSNSSSSSFVILMKKEQYDNFLKDKTVLQKEILKRLDSETVKVFGFDCIKMEWGDGESYYEMQEEIEEEIVETLGKSKTKDISEKFEETTNELYEYAEKNNAFVHSVDY